MIKVEVKGIVVYAKRNAFPESGGLDTYIIRYAAKKLIRSTKKDVATGIIVKDFYKGDGKNKTLYKKGDELQVHGTLAEEIYKDKETDEWKNEGFVILPNQIVKI